MSTNQGYKDLIVYKKAYSAAMEIFVESKKFPKEETYSLTDQIRRSSRSVCAILAKRTEKGSIRNTLFQNYLTVTVNVQKL